MSDSRNNLAPVVATQPRDAERRRFPRYALRGPATIQSRPDMPATAVIMTDISLGGCYVETCALCPVGSRLLVNFEFCDLRIAEFGRVTTSHPMVGMGISFEAATPQLGQLIELLAQGGKGPRPGAQPIAAQTDRETPPVIVPVMLSPQQTHELARALVNWFEKHDQLDRGKFLELLKTAIAQTQR